MNQPPAIAPTRAVEIDANTRYFQQAAKGQRTLCWVDRNLAPRVGDALIIHERDMNRELTGFKLHAIVRRVTKDIGPRFVEVEYELVTERTPGTFDI